MSKATAEERDFFVVTPRTTNCEWTAELAIGTAPNSCVRCKHEKTCGHSHLTTLGVRHVEFSYGPCVLGRMSNGKLFFESH
jgi:hypothetical protein